ncbi:MAG: potassium-transporting ATPase C chain [Rhodanobacteraceae bacterium]|jgi:K+-transporting ATPase ATPase C chain|nr:MAG: potassium-transporting ATPase C chain [Rhodanobacteraceae bacterium]
MISLLRPAVVIFVLLSLITGIAYPLATFGIAQLAFPHQANGSLIVRDAHVIGSALIGQNFDAPKYFWGRPSATTPMAYNANASTGSNLGPSNPALLDAVKQRIAALRAADPDALDPIPSELVMASASGLDPDISPQAAHWQAVRVAKARGMSVGDVDALINAHTQGPSLGLFGEARVNVLALNMALDDAQGGAAHNPRR